MGGTWLPHQTSSGMVHPFLVQPSTIPNPQAFPKAFLFPADPAWGLATSERWPRLHGAWQVVTRKGRVFASHSWYGICDCLQGKWLIIAVIARNRLLCNCNYQAIFSSFFFSIICLPYIDWFALQAQKASSWAPFTFWKAMGELVLIPNSIVGEYRVENYCCQAVKLSVHFVTFLCFFCLWAAPSWSTSIKTRHANIDVTHSRTEKGLAPCQASV